VLILQEWNTCQGITMCIETLQLETAWLVIILQLRFQTLDFQEMSILQIITGTVFNLTSLVSRSHSIKHVVLYPQPMWHLYKKTLHAYLGTCEQCHKFKEP